jgi:preprotein translocase subunit SecE
LDFVVQVGNNKKESVMAKTNPGEFVRQVQREGSKVTWPTPREATVTSFMVFVMVVIMAVFFLGVDFVLNAGIQWLLGFGG